MSVGLPPVGKCIYCGSTEEPLKKEHIIPYGLHGIKILPRASCKACQDITGSLEGYCQGTMLGPLRNALGFRSRKEKRKRQPQTVSVKFNDGSRGALTLPAHETPGAMALPVFPIARALRGLPPDHLGDTTDGGGFWHYMQEDRLSLVSEKYGVQEIAVEGTADPLRFARMLAKIAHVAAVADFGVDGFVHLTPSMILGENGMMNYLVGCGGFIEELPTDRLHAGHTLIHDESGMIVSLVRLFASLGAPTYHVVVGLKPGGRIAKVF